MFTKTEEWNALPSQKMVMTSSSYGKGEWLVSLIGNLLRNWRTEYDTKQTWKDEIRILITDEENLGSVQISIPLYVSDILAKLML